MTNRRPRWIALAAAPALFSLPGAVAQEAEPATTRAEMVAATLAAAERHAATPRSRGSRRALGASLAMLDRLGVRAEASAGEDPIREWRAIAGPSSAPPFRGRLLGPAFRRGWLEPGQALRVEQLFASGQNATVSVAAVPDTPLRLGVSGPGDAAPCRDGQRSCAWMPLFTQRYTITVTNPTERRTRFFLVFD